MIIKPTTEPVRFTRSRILTTVVAQTTTSPASSTCKSGQLKYISTTLALLVPPNLYLAVILSTYQLHTWWQVSCFQTGQLLPLDPFQIRRNEMRQTACWVINPITTGNYAAFSPRWVRPQGLWQFKQKTSLQNWLLNRLGPHGVPVVVLSEINCWTSFASACQCCLPVECPFCFSPVLNSDWRCLFLSFDWVLNLQVTQIPCMFLNQNTTLEESRSRITSMLNRFKVRWE